MNMINKDKTWRTIICLNPNHETTKIETNEIGVILCPKCGNVMVTIIKFMFD